MCAELLGERIGPNLKGEASADLQVADELYPDRGRAAGRVEADARRVDGQVEAVQTVSTRHTMWSVCFLILDLEFSPYCSPLVPLIETLSWQLQRSMDGVKELY
jgi:hypothetical protein